MSHRALTANIFPEIKIPGRKSRAQKHAERLERLQAIELARAPGDNRGWEVKRSDGIGVWQWVEGGRYTALARES